MSAVNAEVLFGNGAMKALEEAFGLPALHMGLAVLDALAAANTP
jgi:hypothetical protein